MERINLTLIFYVILLISACSGSNPISNNEQLEQELTFRREIDTIPVIMNGAPVHSPFGGGVRNFSKPTFADIDSDGDFDLFVGVKGGNLIFFRNTGTAVNPNFTLVSRTFDFVHVGSCCSNPAFVDIDNDEDLDLFMGEALGNIAFFRNTGTATEPNFTLEAENFLGIDVGSFSAPTFADIDNDGDFDLFVGETDGNINFWRNTGTATEPAFTRETENFIVGIGSESAPAFVDIDNDGDLDLFVGEAEGNINFFRNTGTATEPNFTLEAENFLGIDVGSFSAPTFADIDNDGDFDLFVGETDGNINFYRNSGTATNHIFTFETENLIFIDVGNFSAPTFADIDNDGDFDLFVGEREGNIDFYRNTGTATNPVFTLEMEDFASINVGFLSAPTFADIDNDGDLDLFVGQGEGNLHFYRNTGTATDPVFTLEMEDFASINVGGFGVSAPTFADIDNDGDLDLFVGEAEGNINFFRNRGTARDPRFTLETQDFASIKIKVGDSKPTFADIDNDADFDLLVGQFWGGLHFHRNITVR